MQAWIAATLVLMAAAIAAGQTTGIGNDETESQVRALNDSGLASTSSKTGEPLPAPLTLADLEQLALRTNPTLSAARAQVAAARGRQVQGGLRPNPTIGYFGMEIGSQDTAGKQGGFVSKEFVTGGKLRLNQAVAGRRVQEQQFRFDAQQLRVLNDVRLRFYDALVAQRRVALTEELFRVSSQLSGTSQQLLDALQVSESDFLQAEIETQESAIFAANSQNEFSEAWRRLAAVVGIETLGPTALAGDLEGGIPAYEWEQSYSQVLSQNPELAAAQMRVQAARLAIVRARRENVPNVELTASAAHMNQTGDDVAGVQVGIPLPICDRNQGNIMTAEGELISAQNDVRRIELELQERLAATFRRYANARQQVERYQEQILPRAQQSIDLVGRGYSEGQVDFLTLLTSQRTFIRVNLTYLDSLAELRQATTLIDGLLLSGSLRPE